MQVSIRQTLSNTRSLQARLTQQAAVAWPAFCGPAAKKPRWVGSQDSANIQTRRPLGIFSHLRGLHRMTTLVTGATGLLGNNLVRQLTGRGEQVRVLVRKTANPRPLENLDIEVSLGDIRDAEAVRRAVHGVDCIIHSAAWVGIGWSQLAEARAINVEGTRNICQAAVEGATRLIHVSTVDTLAPGTKQQPSDETTAGEKVPCTYVVTKREAEKIAEEAFAQGLPGAIVHPGFMMGPWDWKPSSGRMVLEVTRCFRPVTPIGGCSLTDARDVASAILSARQLEVPGRHYILGGHNITYYDLWCRFRAVAGASRQPWMKAGPLMRVLGGAWGDWVYRLSGYEPELNSAAVRMSSLFNYHSSARAQSELQYQVRPVEEILTDAWNWLVEYGYTGPVAQRPIRAQL